MHTVKASLLIVLLVIPNTTWKDWRNSHSPVLRQLLQTSAIGEMMPRTAGRDTITETAEINTIFAGARMDESDSTSKLDYPALPDNLIRAIAIANGELGGVIVEVPKFPSGKEFLIADANGEIGSAAFDKEILALKASVAKSAVGSALIVVSGCPSQSEYADHQRLCPIAIWQPGMTPSLLSSPSTRTSGLVTNTDIAPTIAKLGNFGELPGPVYGSPVTWAPSSFADSESRLDYIARSAQEQEKQQESVPYFALVLAAILGLLLIFGDRLKFNSGKYLLIQVASLAPFGLITFDHITMFFVVIGISIALTFNPKSPIRNDNSLFIAISLLALIIAGDAIFNHSLLTARSLMGYSFQEGARYYGLGNEAMGVLVGALSVVTIYAGGKRLQQIWLGALIWLFAATIFAVPTIGAKAGGVLVVGVALAGYLITTLWFNKPISNKWLATGIIAACAIGVGLVLVASSHIGGSHVSQTISQTHRFGGSIIFSVIARKLAMDFHLMLHSTWMLVLIVAIAGQMVIRKKWLDQVSDMNTTNLIWRNGIVCTLACLFLNDAGVVAAALCSLFPLAALASESISQANTPVNEI